MHGYRTDSPTWQLGPTCASSFVDLTCLGSRGHLMQGNRTESPARQLGLFLASSFVRRLDISELKGALNAGLSSREPRLADQSNFRKQLR